jgi:hypothetical protein
MLQTWLSSLRARLILLVLLALLPTLAFLLYSHFDQRRHAAQDGSAEALRLANIGSYNQETLIAQAKGLLRTLSLLPQIREASPSMCCQLLAILEPPYLSIANLGVTDLDANVLCSAIPLSGPINIADRQFFQRTLEIRDFGIGTYQISRATGVPSINLGYSVTGTFLCRRHKALFV